MEAKPSLVHPQVERPDWTTSGCCCIKVLIKTKKYGPQEKNHLISRRYSILIPVPLTVIYFLPAVNLALCRWSCSLIGWEIQVASVQEDIWESKAISLMCAVLLRAGVRCSQSDAIMSPSLKVVNLNVCGHNEVSCLACSMASCCTELGLLSGSTCPQLCSLIAFPVRSAYVDH